MTGEHSQSAAHRQEQHLLNEKRVGALFCSPLFEVFEKKRKEQKMIAAGLKKGDKFEDAGRYFVVEEVTKDGNYISREIKEEQAKPKKKKKTDEADDSSEKEIDKE